MKINVFRTQCKEGARVFFDGDVSWKEYFMIDFIED